MRYLLTNLRFPSAEWPLPALGVAFPEIGSDVDPSSVPRPRWIKSHAHHDPRYRRVVHLVRDGRDVAVSFYHWSGANKTMKFDAFMREKIIVPGVGWQAHVEGWGLDQTDDKIVVRYEDLLNDTGSIRRLCDFLGLEPSEALIQQALDRSSVERQQADFDKHPVLKGLKVGVGRGEGSWRDYFTDELLEEFWSAAGETMTKAGYERS